MGQSATPAGEPRGTRYPRATRQHSSCTPVQYLGNASQIQSCHRRRRPPRSAEGDAPADQHSADGPARDSAGGAGATDARELLIVAILHSCAVSQGGHDSRLIYEARRPLLWSMRNCSKTAPGDTSRRYPHLRRFQGCATGNVWQWTERPGKPVCHNLQNGHSGHPMRSPEGRT